MSEFKTPVKTTPSNDPNVSLENLGTPILIPPSPCLQKLGYGTGVTVYRLDRNDNQLNSPWAIKKLSKRCKVENAIKSNVYRSRMLLEASILRTLHHPNIVGFRSIVKDTATGDSSLALECCKISLGDLLEIRLDDYGAVPLPAAEIKVVQRDIARALDYLHTKVFLLHGDIKSHNILVKGDFEICKLCDFGVCLPLEKDTGEVNFKKNSHLSYVGTTLWSAPEVIRESEVISSKADIFSFGLVIYEMITLVPPHIDGMLEDNNDDQADDNDNELEIINISSEIEEENNNKKNKHNNDQDNDCEVIEEIDGQHEKVVKNKLSTKFEQCDEKTMQSSGYNLDMSVDSSIISPGRCTEVEPAAKELDVSYNGDEEELMSSKYGTRPSIPGVMELGEEYYLVLEIFYLCTNYEPSYRPTAKHILDSLK